MMEIPNSVKEIIKRLENFGFEAYIVGGCVRDSILNKIPKDWDITTNALPEEIKTVFKDTKIIETGIKFGTIILIIDNTEYEVTTFRSDGVYSDNRKPDSVNFILDLKRDLARRDLKFNAMAYSEKKGLIDPFNGTNDLKEKIISCVGNPDDRIQEDYLRALRAIRFACTFNYKINEDTKKAITNNIHLIFNISQERIRNELLKILTSDNIIYGFNLLKETGLLYFILPELQNTIDVEQNNPYHIYDVYNHTINSVKNIENILHLKLTMLFHDIAKSLTITKDENKVNHFYGHSKMSSEMAEQILKRFNFDIDTIIKVKKLIGLHDCNIPSTSIEVKKLLNKIGEETFRDLIKVKQADMLAQSLLSISEKEFKLIETLKILEIVLQEKQCFSKKDLLINGRDIMSFGIKEGKEIGNIIDYLVEIVINNPELNTKEKLLEIISKL